MNLDDILIAFQSGALSQAQLRAALAQRASAKRHALSEGQRGLFVAQKSDPEASGYNIPLCLHIDGTLDLGLLRKAFELTLQEHEVLRSVLVEHNDLVQQQISQIAAGFFQTEVAGDDLAAVKRRLAQEAKRAFDLESGPLMRVLLISKGSAEHWLLITIHHIVFDGSSIPILLTTLFSAYIRLLKGETPAPKARARYLDFIAWERQMLASPRGAKSAEYWRTQLAGELPVLELPADHPRTEFTSQRIAQTYIYDAAPSLNALIKEGAKRCASSVAVMLLAVFELLLHKYTNEKDIVVGIPTIGRPEKRFEGVLGYFVNIIALRSQINMGDSLAECCRKLQSTMADGLDHADYPFIKLVSDLGAPRTAGRTPVFQIVFAYQSATMLDSARLRASIPGIEQVRLEEEFLQEGNYEFVLEVIEHDGGFRFNFKYDSGIFERQTIERLSRHYVGLLRHAMEHPDQALRRCPLLTDPEKQQILIEWNDTKRDYPREACIHSLFEQCAMRTPGAAALVFGGKQWNYDQLNRRANQVAHQLLAMNAGKEAAVALCIPRCDQLIIGMLGVLKTGASYLPLDPDLPPSRFAEIIQDAGIRVIMCLASNRQRVESAAPGARCCVLNADFALEQPEYNPKTTVSAEDIAYVIYTSGSTGRPKGVMVRHGGLVNYATHAAAQFDVAGAEGALLSTSISFDLCLTSVYPTLISGKPLYVCSEEDGVASLAESLNSLRNLSPVKLTPTHVSAIHPLLAGHDLRGRVRALVLGGESWSTDLVELWRREAPDTRIFNHYGPTESTVGCLVHEVAAQECGAPPIGRPISNSRAYILDDYLEPVAIGVVGELYIGGAGLARGYLGQPGMTAERFIADPFSEQGGARLYRTGDLARYGSDGQVHFFGRKDQQVKLRGYRIELSEIEAALRIFPDVEQALVMVRQDGEQKQLVAYVVLHAAAILNQDAVTAHMTSKLPQYMLPITYTVLQSIPLKGNGKVNFQALPKPSAGGQLSQPHEEPRSEPERVLAAIWKDVLKLDRVGTNDNFFELGGDSIIAIQIVAKAKRAGIRITPKQLLEQPVISRLVRLASIASAQPADQSAVVGQLPLSAIQRWFFERGLKRPNHYNQSLFFRISGPIDVNALHQSVEFLVKHHEALRSRFFKDAQGQLVQESAAGDLRVWSQMELTASNPHDRLSQLEDSNASIQASFDLAAGPLFKAVLYEWGDEKRLLLACHHLVVDGVSWRIVLDDLATVYEQLTKNEAPSLPAATPFSRWAKHIHEYSQSTALMHEVDHWTKLGDVDAAIPSDGDGSENSVATLATVNCKLSEEDTRSLLQRVPGAYRTHINDILLAALSLVLAEWSGKPGVLIDLEGHGREELGDGLDFSRTVGWFTAIYPVLLQPFQQGRTLSATIKTVKEQLREIPGKGVGYGVLRYLQGDATVSSILAGIKPCVKFNYLGQFSIAERLPLKPAAERDGGNHAPDNLRSHLLEINALMLEGSLHLNWCYSRAMHSEATIARLAARYQSVLAELIFHCLEPNAGGLTPSDFNLASLDQAALDRLHARHRSPSGVRA
jgi:amino acid adenylation domain-containing protein/non-ribosomal peptide synthase protein (TIGR01720 family)